MIVLSSGSTWPVYVLRHLLLYAFYYITVAYVPYDFDVLRNVGHDPLVNFEITLVSHDPNFKKWNRIKENILEYTTYKNVSYFGLWSGSLKAAALCGNDVFSFFVTDSLDLPA